MHEKEGFMFHLNFLAKPTKCTDESETMLFFGEVREIYPEEPRVTNCCILGSADAGMLSGLLSRLYTNK